MGTVEEMRGPETTGLRQSRDDAVHVTGLVLLPRRTGNPTADRRQCRPVPPPPDPAVTLPRQGEAECSSRCRTR